MTRFSGGLRRSEGVLRLLAGELPEQIMVVIGHVHKHIANRLPKSDKLFSAIIESARLFETWSRGSDADRSQG